MVGYAENAIKNVMQIELDNKEIELVELATNEFNRLPYSIDTVRILKLLQTLNEKVLACKLTK